MKRGLTFLFFGYLLLSSLACKENKKVIETPEIVFNKEGDLQLLKYKTDSLLANIAIEIADSDYEKQTGLMYRKHMEKNQGMLFVYDDMRMHSFYMKNTHIPLDLIFIDDKKRIVSFKENAQPFDTTPLPSEVPVQYILELNAGMAEQLVLEIGDHIRFTRD